MCTAIEIRAAAVSVTAERDGRFKSRYEHADDIAIPLSSRSSRLVIARTSELASLRVS